MANHYFPFRWPASRLNERDVQNSLRLLSRQTGTPITVIIEEAVCAHLNDRLESQAPAPIGFVTTAIPSTPQPAA